MLEEDFDFENLKSQTFKLLDELKNSKNQEILKDKISTLWKNIPLPDLNKDSDISISKSNYKHGEETTLYMIIYHLFKTGNEDVVNEFYAEYDGKYKKFIEICINNYQEFVSYLNKFKEDDYSLEDFINQIGISDELKFYHSIYIFLEQSDPSTSITDLKSNLKSVSGKFINKTRQYLKCLVIPTLVPKKKIEVKDKITQLFLKEFCKLRDFVHGDFLPLVFDQGCLAYKCLLKNNFAFKHFEDIMLPIEIKLDKSREFHSLFVCPVIKEVCIDENKPVLLECNHVISYNAANVLSKYGAVEVFKCPYCPVMTGYNKIVKLELYR